MENKRANHKTEKTANYARENELLEHVWKRVIKEDADPLLDVLLQPQPKPPPARQKPDQPNQDEPLDCNKALQAHIANELEDVCLYRCLARMYPKKAQLFSALASEELRHAKRLCAAYFLRTGIRFWPVKSMKKGKMPDYCSMLRIRFFAEQSQAERYRNLARTIQEEDLATLYQELAEEEKEHARTIRRLLEKAI